MGPISKKVGGSCPEEVDDETFTGLSESCSVDIQDPSDDSTYTRRKWSPVESENVRGCVGETYYRRSIYKQINED